MTYGGLCFSPKRQEVEAAMIAVQAMRERRAVGSETAWRGFLARLDILVDTFTRLCELAMDIDGAVRIDRERKPGTGGRRC
ncbi:hypothetical protein Misp05_44780 [Micromonospora sp. NBRC 107095]|nr:hypothetical protein Misp05_44780 [Micromonospora sp. NBRC 107095]